MLFKKLLENEYKNPLDIFQGFDEKSAHAKFYAWQKSISKHIVPVSYKTISGIEDEIKRYLKFHKPKIKDCYTTAYKLVDILGGDFRYIDGITSIHGVPIDHSWNSYKGQHFDLTNEIVFKGGMNLINYTQILELDEHQIHTLALKTGFMGPFVGAYYKIYVDKS